MTVLLAILANPLVHGALQGALAAATVDLLAFRKWSSWDDAAKYDWSVASWRWLQGAMTGLMAAAGLNAVVPPA